MKKITFKDKLIAQLLFFVFCFNSSIICNENKPLLKDYGYNIYSQFGEGGIIEKIFEIIEKKSKTAIEFGAWDGIHLSNTANLWMHQQWNAILIESDPLRCMDLYTNTSKFPNVVSICKKVGITKDDSLEAILKSYNISSDIDLLSIDIDGDDYYIFESLENLKPRVIICEYNPTFPAHLDIYPESGQCVGCSVSALKRIAEQKGYELVALTDVNCFFVIKEEFGKFKNVETSFEKIKFDRYLRYIITDYQGNYKIVTSPNFKECFGLVDPLKSKLLGNFKTWNFKK